MSIATNMLLNQVLNNTNTSSRSSSRDTTSINKENRKHYNNESFSNLGNNFLKSHETPRISIYTPEEKTKLLAEIKKKYNL